MRKVFGTESYQLFPLEDGFILVERQPLEEEDKIAVGYRLISFSKGTVGRVSKKIYYCAKFGPEYEAFVPQLCNAVEPNVVALEKGRLFIASPDGSAGIYDADGTPVWQGTMRYNDCGPYDLVAVGGKLWASYPEQNALIRFNLTTMREELRIGGKNSAAFSVPQGLAMGESPDILLVCNAGSHKISAVNLQTYTVADYETFEEPVHQYIKVLSNEIVLLDSGVYKL